MDDFIGYIDESKGLKFEKEIFSKLESELDINKKILHNVKIMATNGKYTQIDLILITYAGIYVIESKNWSGKLIGESSRNKWIQILSKKYYPNNPIKQNQYHIDKLSQYLNLDKDLFKSYIVFPEKTNIDNIKFESNDNLKILKINTLFDTIISDLKNKDIRLSYEEIDKIYMNLKYIK